MRSQFREALSQKRTLPVIVATSLNDSAIAKTHRKRVVNILESDGNDNVVGVYGDRQILSVLPDEAVLDNLENSIYKEESATLTSSLTGIEVFHPIVDEYKDGTVDYRVRLFDYNDFDRNGLARILFEKYCEEIGVQIQKRIRFTADMYIYRVSISAQDKYLRFVEFEGLYSVEITSPLFVTLDSLADDVIVSVRYPEDGEEYPVVGVLDIGIAPIGHLSPWLLENEHTNYPEEYTNRLHGTAVASIIEYSDDLNGTDICSTDGVNLFSALVYPNQRIYPEDLVDNIREAVERNPDIKIWNMSLNKQRMHD